VHPRPRPERRELVLLIAPIVALSAAALVGAALTPTLAPTHPLTLLFLDARNRTLVLVATRVDLAAFLAVAVVRRLASDPLYYVLGRRYGERAVRWIERQFGGGVIKATEVVFRRASYPMVFLFPGALVCALAGQTGMHPVVFAILNVGGTVAVVLTLRGFGTTVLADPVETVLGFFNDHRAVTTAASVGLVLLYLVMQKVTGRIETPSIDELEAELAGESEQADGLQVEEAVEADGHAAPGADGLDREDDPRQER
jgi:membrane protein DedA with SNARE-associated domain